jgi:hypothetical protein
MRLIGGGGRTGSSEDTWMKVVRALLLFVVLLLAGCAYLRTSTGGSSHVTATPTAIPGQTATVSSSPTVTFSPTVTLKPSLVATGRPTDVPTPSATATLPPATPTPTPSPVPSSTPTPEPSPTPSPTPMLVPTPRPEQLVAQPGTAWNLELVGHDALGSVGWHGGLALEGHCAYVGSYDRAAVAIVDISDPAHPTQLGQIDLAPGLKPVEVRVMPGLDLLVVADVAGNRKLLTFDVSDCSQPVPLGSLTATQPAHEFYLWSDGSRVLAYLGTFANVPPNLIVVDLTDPTQPREVATWKAGDEGVPGILHSLSVSPDGSTAYLAMWKGGFVVAGIDLPQVAVKRGPDGGFAPAQVPSVHSAVPLQDPQFVLLASEVFSCPFAGLSIADISDPSHPTIISQFTLPENRCTNLPPGGALFTPHNPLVAGDLGFVSWYGAGVQAVDLSDPRAPRRVGQFVPTGEGAAPRGLMDTYPVQMLSYPILRDGLLYVVDSQSGLYVLRYTGPGAERLVQLGWVESNRSVLP